MKNIRLGDVLIEFGYITPDQLNTALAYQKEHRDLRVGQALQELGYVNERQVLEALAQRLQLTMIDIEHTNVDVTAVEKVPQELAQKYDMLPIAQSPRALTIAANDPLNYYALEDIRQLTGLEPEIVLAELEPLRRAIRYYYAEVSARKAARTANDSDMAAAQTEDLAIDMTAEGGDLDAPIIRLLNSLVQRAVTTTASDIHIEPFEGETKVRMRIDGVIIDYVTLQRALHQPLIARIKIMSNLDIAEHRIPQDGHFRARLETGPDVNVRVSILPTVFGEKAVLRILSSNTYIKNASHFGMNDETYKRFLPLLNRPNGIVYLTGPTGSGKTTTLYMVLQTIAERQVNVSTIEDPVERNLARINQTQVNNIAGLTFESGLRAHLGEDFPYLPCQEAEVVDEILALAAEAFAELLVLCGDARRARVQVAFAHHHAAQYYECGRGEAVLLGAEACHLDDVHTVLELSVGLYLDPAAQVVHDERLLSLGQTYLDGHAGVFY